jgi:hypothetical protein
MSRCWFCYSSSSGGGSSSSGSGSNETYTVERYHVMSSLKRLQLLSWPTNVYCIAHKNPLQDLIEPFKLKLGSPIYTLLL